MVRKVNILKHELVPEARLLTKEEVKEIFRRMEIRISEIPWIFASDPMAKALGAKPGDVIMIIRKSKTSGKSVAFRFVMPG
ncbi:MAG: DNA-directed RNA polymerase subunit H [Thermoproteales archaeon]|nr:DNA-directed RNA polymerase subunit H [Thermoproteales archaeon]